MWATQAFSQGYSQGRCDNLKPLPSHKCGDASAEKQQQQHDGQQLRGAARTAFHVHHSDLANRRNDLGAIGMANKENLPPRLTTTPISRLSPSHKPALGQQRDHSACRTADTPLKVKKTRENLRQPIIYPEVPPPCLHVPHAAGSTASDHTHGAAGSNAAQSQLREIAIPQPSQATLDVQPRVQRQKSVSRRMLSRVKQGISSASKSSQSIQTTGSETSLARRLSGRRKLGNDAESRAHSFELRRDSVESTIEEVSGANTETPPPVQRSFTDSTVSTSEIIEDLALVQIPSFQIGAQRSIGVAIEGTIKSSPSLSPSDPSPEPTPRPRRKGAGIHDYVSVAVPCVDLQVDLDSYSVDVNSKRDVWIAITATIKLRTSKLARSSSSGGDETHSCGTITNLRLCYKATEGCRMRNIIGQKSYRDVSVGQQCSLFIKLGVPRMQSQVGGAETDQDSLFAELESMVGTLETDILHVEARYMHSLLQADNIVAVKHTCKLLRPQTESRWSIIGLYEKDDIPTNVHAQLARYLAGYYSAHEALELLHRYFDFDTRGKPGLAEICSMLQDKINLQRSGLEDPQPEVVVTDIDLPATDVLDTPHGQFDTAPSTAGDITDPQSDAIGPRTHGATPSSLWSSTLAPPRISDPRTTTAITAATSLSSSPSTAGGHESHDSARQLWRHIRRTSLSTRQLEEMTPERLSSLEAGDDSLKELRRRAIANKRSIGAETLRIWKWEGEMQGKERPVEAPWM